MCKLAAVSQEHEGTAIFQNVSNYTSQHVLVPYKTSAGLLWDPQILQQKTCVSAGIDPLLWH